MQVSANWRTTALVAAALLVGSIAGPPLASAAVAAAGLTVIGGGHGSGQAAVRNGALSVNADLPTTAAGQLQAAEASPSRLVHVIGDDDAATASICNTLYVVPKHDALIVTGGDLFAFAASTSTTVNQLAVETGPASAPCGGNRTIFAGLVTANAADTSNQSFQPGIAVPAGDAVGMTGDNESGTVILYGYLVPAAAVPAGASAKASVGGSTLLKG
jgi:hypothetical protein